MARRGIYACPNCGGRSIDPLQLVSGPMATVDDWDGSYRCLECGKVAVPLYFRNAEEWVLFRQSKSKNAPPAEEGGFAHIAIAPVDTRPLWSQTGFDLPLIKVVDVVTVEWSGGSFRRTDYAARFDRYWRAVSGTRYNCKQILLMDLAGICDGKPNFKAMRDLVKSKYEVWLDLGIENEQDLFDSFSLEAYKALADTSTSPSLKLFEEIYALSDRCVPCVQLADDVVWAKPQPRLRRLEDALDALQRIGFTEMAIMDLKGLGRRRGVSEELMSRLEGFKGHLYLGGGVVEGDLERMKKAGLAGAFIEPFTPVIKDILDKGEEKVAADAPSTTPVARKMPKYLATD